jgi:hypothetical protein
VRISFKRRSTHNNQTLSRQERTNRNQFGDFPMADKRNSVAGKVATPNLKAGSGSTKDVIDVDSNLHKAVGSRYVSSICSTPDVSR